MIQLGTATTTESKPPEVTTSTLADLAALRRRIQHGFTLLEACETQERVTRIEQQLATLRGDYYIAVNDFKHGRPQDELHAECRRYEKRLVVGWEKPDTAAVLARFDEVLSEYLVLCDALLGTQVVTTHLDAQLRLIRASHETKGRK